jgi:hypothetical protein
MKILTVRICLTIVLLINSSVVISEEFKTINTRDGVTVSFVKNTPLKDINTAAILFAGGEGSIGIDVDGKYLGSENFLVRSRKLFSELGVLTITPDTPSDMMSIKNQRGSLRYRTDISFLIKEIRSETTKPIWLIGTSRGSIAVGYHAAALDIQGVVLTATVTDGNHDTIWNTDLRKINVPALVVHHRHDACHVSPSSGAENIFKQLTNSSKKHLLLFEDGDIGSGRDCGATTFHGFLGIEKQVVATIFDWMFKAIREKN